jgi:hypothetical protein
MSDFIHREDPYAWLRDEPIVFAEDDFAKVQAERDALRLKVIELRAEVKRLETENSRHV